MELHVISLIVGVVIGGTIIWFVRGKSFLAQKSRLEERTKNLESSLSEIKSELSEEREKGGVTQKELSTAQTENSHLKEKLAKEKSDVEELQKTFTAQFENLAGKILDEKSTKFTEQNQTNISAILKPLQERLKDFQVRVEQTYDRESKQRFSLEKELKRLFELNEQMSKEANNLTNALKGESKTQGNWGEMILETLLEKSGLIKNTHFEVQKSVTTEEGKRLQPDVVIHLPEDKNMIIDSKVSLTAYERYYGTEEEPEKEAALKQHIASLKKHIDELSQKKYQDLYGIHSPDFVLLFVPIEPAFGLAVLHEPGLFNYAVEKNVAIISPTTLLATLRMIATIWRQEYQNKNVLEIARQSGGLYDKFVGLVDDLKDIEKNINNTQKSYASAFNKLSGGKGNIITRIEKLRHLGAKTSKKLAAEIIDEADMEIKEIEE